MLIIAAVFYCVNQLTYNQQGGVAGIVVNIFQPLIHYAPVVGGEHIHMVALKLKELAEHTEMHREHLRHKYCIFFLHFLCENEAAGFIINQFSH